MTTVSNSTPLISLAMVGLFDLLHALYGTITIPEKVYEEVVIQGQGRPGAIEVANALWIVRRAVAAPQSVAQLMATNRLQQGESEAIALALEMQATRILLDERAARRGAEAQQLSVIGTVGILLLAKSQSLIVAVKPPLDALKASGIRLGDVIYKVALRRAGE